MERFLKLLAVLSLFILLPAASAEVSPTVFWSYETGGTVTGVAISDDGNYTAAASSDGYVYLLNKSKKLMWRVETDDTPLKVAISSDGNEIFVGDESKVYLYNRSGDVIWEFQIGDSITDIAATPSGDRIAVGSLDYYIYLLSMQGGMLWKYKANAPVMSVAISSDGRFIAAGTSGSITYMLNKNGNLLWEYISGKSIDGVGILGEQVVSGERYLTFLKDGNKIGAHTSIACDISSLETTADSEYVLLGCNDGNLYFLDSSRKKRWSYDAEKTSRDSSISFKGDYVAVAGGKTIYILESPDIVPPVVEITLPEAGAAVSGTVEIDASVTDDSSYVLKVLIDGDYACAEVPCNWNTGAAADGQHTITVEVNDSAGNVGEDSIDVTLGHTILRNITDEISEKQELIKETEEALKERLDDTLPADFDLPPLREHRDFGPVIQAAALLLLAVYIALRILKLLKPKKSKKYKWKKRR